MTPPVENVGLDGGAESDDFVGVELGVRLAAEIVLHGAADERDAGGCRRPGRLLRFARASSRRRRGACLHGAHGAVDDGLDERFEFGAGEFVGEEFAVRKSESVRAVSVSESSCLAAMRLSELLRWIPEANRACVSRRSRCTSLQEFVDVVAAEVGVAVSREDLIDVAFGGGDEFEDGNFEGSAAEIVNGYVAAFFLRAGRRRELQRWVH